MKKRLCIVFALLFVATSFARTNVSGRIDATYEAYIDAKDYDGLISAITASTDTYTAMQSFYLGLAYFYKGEDERAQQYFARATEKEPKFFEAWYYLAGSYLYAADYDSAIFACKKCLKISAYSECYKMLAAIYTKQGDEKSAKTALQNCKKSLKKEIQKNPEDSDAISDMIFVCYKLKTYSDSEPYKKLLREQWAKIKGKKRWSFAIDEWDYGGVGVVVYESYAQPKDEMFYYWQAALYNEDGIAQKAVNLEFDPLIAELFTDSAYIVGIDYFSDDHYHETTDIAFAKPDYEQFVTVVQAAIDGVLTVSASSRMTQ